jgi:colanic acid biosynthesis protein WcaH
MRLASKDYVKIVERVPIACIDLLIVRKSRLLMAVRNNTPAKDFLFVPGGRVFKGETQNQCIFRLLNEEGLRPLQDKSQSFNFIGVFDHFYDVGPFDVPINSHYVVCAYRLDISSELCSSSMLKSLLSSFELSSQHRPQTCLWVEKTYQGLPAIHQYSANYFSYL